MPYVYNTTRFAVEKSPAGFCIVMIYSTSSSQVNPDILTSTFFLFSSKF